MSTEWRRKTYYKPRVMINTARILDPQFSDGLMCITGPQIEMLRNVTQYLRRRSTFASEYHEGYYLAPDTSDWDDIQAIVSDLEETLMGCEELMELFTDMLTAMQCVCNKAEQPATDSGSVTPIVDIGLEDGDLIVDDIYGSTTEIEARRCAVAQLTYWQAWEWLTEIIQPFQENAMDVVVPAALALIATMVGAGPLAIPAGALIVLMTLIFDIWVDGSLADVQNSLLAHREELICALYNGLSYDYDSAHLRARNVIDDIEGLSPVDLVVMRALFAPWAQKLASLAYTAATDWAVANVAAGACDDCTWVYEKVYEFPPVPADWTGGFPDWIGRYPGINQNEDGYSVDFELPSIVDNVDFEYQVIFSSALGFGFTVGYVTLEYQDGGMAWHSFSQATCTTTVLAGFWTDQTTTDTDKTVTTNTLRVHIRGQAAQSESDPWPFMPRYIRVKAYPHV